MNDPEERRAFERTNTNFEAMLVCEHRGSVVTVTNCSENGMCVDSISSFQPCTSEVDIIILKNNTHLKISGKVVRVTDKNDSSTTIGIAFFNPPITI